MTSARLKKPKTKTTFSLAVLIGCLLASAAEGETLDYDCAVDAVQIWIHVDTETLIVTETAQKDGITEIGRYSDGAFGPIANTSAESRIPSVHQFVRIRDQKIYFGAELAGKEDGAVLDRQLATLTIRSRKSGWCSQSADKAR